MSAQEYLSETVVYGGEEVTRGAMIADLQATAKALTDDPIRQKMIVNAYLGGFDRRNRG